MRSFSKASFAAGAIVALVVGSGTALAANGKPVLLGRSNAATVSTNINNPQGTALRLGAKPGTQPLTVSNNIKVINLNADTVDGVHGTQLARTSGRTKAISRTGDVIDLDNDGADDAIFASVGCPEGTQLTGGGMSDETISGLVVSSAPDADFANFWSVVAVIDPAAGDVGEDLTATVICYNPLGPVRVPANWRHSLAERKAADVMSPQLRAKILAHRHRG